MALFCGPLQEHIDSAQGANASGAPACVVKLLASPHGKGINLILISAAVNLEITGVDRLVEAEHDGACEVMADQGYPAFSRPGPQCAAISGLRNKRSRSCRTIGLSCQPCSKREPSRAECISRS